MAIETETPGAVEQAPKPAKKPRDTRYDRPKKFALVALALAAIVLSMRAWRAYANVVECEQTFIVVDQQMDQNKWDDALTNLDHCLALNPLHYPSYDAKVYILVHVRGDKEQARATLLEAVRNLPDHPLAHRRLGEFYLLTSAEYDNALVELRRSCELDPTDATSRALLRKAGTMASKRP